MALINGKVLLQDFVCGFVVIFAMVVCFVSISFEKTILNESYLLNKMSNRDMFRNIRESMMKFSYIVHKALTFQVNRHGKCL